MNSKNVGWTLLLTAGIGMAATYLGCSSLPVFRAPASSEYDAPKVAVTEAVLEVAQQDARIYGGNVRFPQGLSKDEALELWHLSEGSEVFPLAWFMRMGSEFSILKDTKLSERLDEKFNVIKENKSFAAISPFPLPWVGITAAWSEEHPQLSDVRLTPSENIEDAMGIRPLDGQRESIAMLGVNCAFCHSNVIQIGKTTRLLDGAPSMLNIRGFFQDMFASTAKTMLTEELLEKFLRESKVTGDTQDIAHEFVRNFKKELGLDTWAQRRLGPVINFLDSEYFSSKKTKTLRQTMFTNKEVVEKYLTRLLKLTYGMKDVSTELKLRMRFLANSIGVNPDLPLTPEGFARTDAFGRISNLVARTKNPIPLTATASVPPMWNIEYRSLFHWNANTNSVVMRNMGQSFGLGSVLTGANGQDPLAKYDSTTNLHNLHRLETLLYKIQLPRWREDFKADVDVSLLEGGCKTYHNTCAKCHLPEYDRVGPQKALINYKLIPMQTAGTDALYSKQQAIPVEGVAFKDALFRFTGAVRDRYYQRFDVSPEDQAAWEHRELRGPELFRDTYLGESGHTGVSSYMNVPANPAPGYPARHLAGVWATAPYLHNGSVPNLYELLKPAHARPKMFFVGSRQYDANKLGFRSEFDSLPTIPDLEARAQALLSRRLGIMSRIKGVQLKAPENIWEAKVQVACQQFPERCFDISHVGNTNQGHEGPAFGTNLSEREKRELVEFLKVLRPEPEYTQMSRPAYRWDGKSCQIF